MNSEEVITISEIISIWGWHLLAFIFLVNSLHFLVDKKYIFFFGLIGVFIICELVSLNRKWSMK